MKLIALMAVALMATATQANLVVVANDSTPVNGKPINVHRHTLGSGEQGVKGFEVASPVLENHIYHGPQYMPFYPTAAVIWPRVIEIDCFEESAHGLNKCKGYNWAPSMGRAEYLFVTPRYVKPAPPVIVEKIVTVPGPERIILKEVPVKPKKE